MSFSQRLDIAEEAVALAEQRARSLRARAEEAAADLRARAEEAQHRLGETRHARHTLETQVAAATSPGTRAATADKFYRWVQEAGAAATGSIDVLSRKTVTRMER